MSDRPQGEGWWQASDGLWYPPQQQAAAPDAGAATGPPDTAPTGPGPQPEQSEGNGSGRGKVVAALIVLLVLIAAGVGAYVVLSGDEEDPVEPSTSDTTDIGDATGELTDDGPIEFDTEYRDRLEGNRTEARYTLEAPDGAIMTLAVTNVAESQRPVFVTFESGGQRFESFRVPVGGEQAETVILDDSGAATFDLTFTEGPAEFTFEVGLEIQDDAGEGGDAGAELSTAFEIAAGQEVTALLGGEDDTDHFTVDARPGTELTVTAAVDASAERAVLFTVQLDGDRLFSERVQPGAETTLGLLLGDGDEGMLQVVATEGPADYTFTVAFAEQNEGGQSGDAPADLANSRTVDAGAAITGSVGDRDDGDHYTFTAPGPAFTITGSSDATSQRGYLIVVEDASGSRRASFRVQPGAQSSEAIEVEAGSQVRLIVTEGPATYSISIG